MDEKKQNLSKVPLPQTEELTHDKTQNLQNSDNGKDQPKSTAKPLVAAKPSTGQPSTPEKTTKEAESRSKDSNPMLTRRHTRGSASLNPNLSVNSGDNPKVSRAAPSNDVNKQRSSALPKVVRSSRKTTVPAKNPYVKPVRQSLRHHVLLKNKSAVQKFSTLPGRAFKSSDNSVQNLAFENNTRAMRPRQLSAGIDASLRRSRTTAKTFEQQCSGSQETVQLQDEPQIIQVVPTGSKIQNNSSTPENRTNSSVPSQSVPSQIQTPPIPQQGGPGPSGSLSFVENLRHMRNVYLGLGKILQSSETTSPHKHEREAFSTTTFGSASDETIGVPLDKIEPSQVIPQQNPAPNSQKSHSDARNIAPDDNPPEEHQDDDFQTDEEDSTSFVQPQSFLAGQNVSYSRNDNGRPLESRTLQPKPFTSKRTLTRLKKTEIVNRKLEKSLKELKEELAAKSASTFPIGASVVPPSAPPTYVQTQPPVYQTPPMPTYHMPIFQTPAPWPYPYQPQASPMPMQNQPWIPSNYGHYFPNQQYGPMPPQFYGPYSNQNHFVPRHP